MSPPRDQTLAEDEELRLFASAAGGSGERLSVIVEAQTPPVRIGRSLAGDFAGLQRRPLSVSGAQERAQVGQRNLSRILEVLAGQELAEPPVVLPAGHAVVTHVTPQLLRVLMELPEVGTIRRNKTLPIGSLS